MQLGGEVISEKRVTVLPAKLVGITLLVTYRNDSVAGPKTNGT